MKIKKSTPMDLLRQDRDNSGEAIFKPCRTEQKMGFYLTGVAICPECETRITIAFNLDETIYHECNRGNRVTYVPRTATLGGK